MRVLHLHSFIQRASTVLTLAVQLWHCFTPFCSSLSGFTVHRVAACLHICRMVGYSFNVAVAQSFSLSIERSHYWQYLNMVDWTLFQSLYVYPLTGVGDAYEGQLSLIFFRGIECNFFLNTFCGETVCCSSRHFVWTECRAHKVSTNAVYSFDEKWLTQHVSLFVYSYSHCFCNCQWRNLACQST